MNRIMLRAQILDRDQKRFHRVFTDKNAFNNWKESNKELVIVDYWWFTSVEGMKALTPHGEGVVDHFTEEFIWIKFPPPGSVHVPVPYELAQIIDAW